ncbi:hypothetical protein M2R29_08340 [Aeromonas hydrophila]|uniref:hypothetical protein n=1 Tax=Aeromonas hydrophila TaxID=644 RepID=UPI00207C265A|nr:hypothetical protein [Aeromonas hydrophila]MCO4207950.1 hypothetical protein [Aeromonas hydrophila]
MSNLVPFSGRKGRLKFEDNSGNDGGDGSMEARVAKLESDVGHIMRDVSEIKQKLERVADDVNDLKVSITAQSGRQDAFLTRLDVLDKKIDGLDKKFATKEDLQSALHSQTKWLIVSMLALVGGAIGILKYFGL